MKKKTTNKLVRDKIPNILMEQDKAFKAHKLDDEEFENELANKLVEEANEAAEKVHWLNHKCNQEPVSNEELNSDLEGITEELADVLEVYIKLVKSLGLKTKDLEKAVKEKRERNGGFENKIFLEWFEDKKEKK